MADSPDLGAGFSPAKRAVLLALKRAPGSSLRELATALGVSRVAALQHLATLEGAGLVAREYRANGVGRPRVHFRLAAGAARLFPEAYGHLSVCALGFIEERLGRSAVVELLQQRAREVRTESRDRFTAPGLPARVAELARLRDEGGYMAAVGPSRRGTIELREHNCPILAIAEKYPEACEVERRMFESMLDARVQSAHRVVAGDPVCRFLVRPREPSA